jgi:hypothetical protein
MSDIATAYRSVFVPNRDWRRHEHRTTGRPVRRGPAGARPAKTPDCLKGRRFSAWPLILIDVHTEEGIVGRSYLEPYLADAANYIVPVIHQLAAARQGKPIRNGAWAVVAGRRHGPARPERLAATLRLQKGWHLGGHSEPARAHESSAAGRAYWTKAPALKVSRVTSCTFIAATSRAS